ncbi:MAG: glutamine-hydrolyzing carbamoyl-phosphate synthase small subunit [Ectothiorhodospiraceae bacterium]|nr:glutamine-hydrolyzing carbamoyl-phosphate synthase small subunit [Ectothiorhodospiraceae bacterium]MCH8503115.1 glutamine-hydrolyzing carbamoyl-phosphate synthase small subunit [Ectothiorhodospiraceae bacterium]
MNAPAILALADGTVLRGEAIGVDGMAVGEVVFNTAMTGYQEICTDPSYSRQLVTLTYSHVGNVGANAIDEESRGAMLAGLVIRDLPLRASSWRSEESLSDYLKRNQVVAIAGVDTRRLTRILREKGAQDGCIMAGDVDEARAIKAARGFPGLKGMDLAQTVSCDEAYVWTRGSWDLEMGREDAAPRDAASLQWHVVAYDYGIKHNILRLLVDHGCKVTVVPARTPASEVLAMSPDGVFFSNGPGDPEPCDYAIEAIAGIVDSGMPSFGICLGHQLLGLASGAKSVKMKFGHHGANHPVLDVDTGRVMISSQNHGFAVDEDSLPANVRATHRSLFDGSLQGIHRTDQPAFSFQGHPEASPGPHDVAPLFAHFVELMRQRRG